MADKLNNELSLSDMVLGFFEEIERGGEERRNGGETGDDDDDDSTGDDKTHRDFWQNQNKLLLGALNKSSATEKKIRAETKEAIQKLKSENSFPSCSNHVLLNGSCRNCTLNQIVQKLHQAGYNSALCKSKWCRSTDVPSGEHSYIDIIMESRSYSKNQIRVIIELNFRAEFEMVRANQQYQNLVNSLPEIFVGKSEKLKNVVKIMCEAAEKCTKENKMHMAPWRKQKYMQSKWMATPERSVHDVSVPVPIKMLVPVSEGRNKSRRASMLTFDLRCIEPKSDNI
ncbi:hypothetical protein LUZ60_008421 [Juncus effusus]|nr:hypothetical protein LUZ60_008421 [Juncus effusus]